MLVQKTHFSTSRRSLGDIDTERQMDQQRERERERGGGGREEKGEGEGEGEGERERERERGTCAAQMLTINFLPFCRLSTINRYSLHKESIKRI